MIEALRDIGYSLEAAVTDIIDNSLTARAKNVHIRFGWDREQPWIALIDDGYGMTEKELVEAMRPGSRNPREKRSREDLGRFGLGLKTASFSQCLGLTVASPLDDARAPTRRLHAAHSDASGLSIFEEAQYQGVRAAERVLARSGARAESLL